MATLSDLFVAPCHRVCITPSAEVRVSGGMQTVNLEIHGCGERELATDNKRAAGQAENRAAAIAISHA